MDYENLIKMNEENCIKCSYHCISQGYVACNYSLIEGHSRIFENGKRRNIPDGYCDKFISIDNGKEMIEKYNAQLHSSVIIQKPKEVW